jgi:hypothetical protein
VSARWWDDAAVATAVLASVDDSDVVQGVGTATLGLHALAKAAVSPLAARTLIDRADVAAALAVMPQELVAKALAAATRPVLGEAAGRYGVLLAGELAEQAAAGTDRVVAGLVAKGLPMPLAVARAAEVAGLPPNRTGPFIEAMKEVMLPAVVIADAADRALMGYAQALGQREATPFEVEVTKAAGIRFREEEHPRNSLGEFAAKPEVDEEQQRKDARTARRKARRGRRLHRAGRAAAAAAATPPPPRKSLRELAESLLAREPEPERRKRVRRRQRVAEAAPTPTPSHGPKRQPRTRPKPRLAAEPVMAIPVKYDEIIAWEPTDEPFVVMVDRKTADLIAGGGAFAVSVLQELTKQPFVAHAGTRLQAVEDHRMVGTEQMQHYEDVVALVLPRNLPVAEDYPGRHAIGYRLPGQAVLRVRNADTWRNDIVSLHDEPLAQMGIDKSGDYAVMHLGLDNEKELKANPAGNPPEGFEKAHLEDWTVNGVRVRRQVERDAQGEFAEVDTGGEKAERTARKKARQARRKHRAGRARRAGLAQREQPRSVQPSLAELVAALQERGALAKPSRVRQRQRMRPRTAAPGQQKVAGNERAKAQVGFARQQASQITEGELEDLIGSRLLAKLRDNDIVATVPNTEFELPMGMVAVSAQAAVDEYLKYGSGLDYLGTHHDLRTAMAQSGDRSLIEQVEGGAYDVYEPYYDPSSMLVYGDQKALNTLLHPDGHTRVRLELVSRTVADLGHRENADVFGGQTEAVPLVAIKVTLLDDKQW